MKPIFSAIACVCPVRTGRALKTCGVSATSPTIDPLSPRQTVTLNCRIVTVGWWNVGETAANRGVRLGSPTPVSVTVRSPRPRDYLTEREVEKLMDAARENRWGHRDATAIMLAYRHGLRASELVALRWDNLQAGKLHVRRVKGGETSVHPLGARELRAPLPASPAA